MTGDLIREALETVGRVRLTVGGRSMWPFIPDRSTVEIRRITPGRIRLGDVVMLWTGPDRFLLHRVMRIRRNGADRSVLIKGDRRLNHDGWHAESSLAGVVTQLCYPGKLLPPISGRALRGLGLVAWITSTCTLAIGYRGRS